MAVIKSGATSDQMTVDVTSKAARATLYDSAAREISYGVKKTYSAAGKFTPPATPTDLVTIFGSATKTVIVKSFKLGTQNTAAGSQEYVLSKRSAVTTGGTAVAATAIPHDSANAAATATVSHYTAAPTAGTALGNVSMIRAASSVLIPATWASIQQIDGVQMLPLGDDGVAQPVTLRGVAEGLAVNFAGVALVAGQIHTYNIVWTEE